MTPEQIAAIRDLRVDSLSGDAPHNPDVWTLEQARKDLLAEVERLTRKLADTEAHLADACSEAREAAEVRDTAQAEVERLTAALTAVDQDAAEARMEREEAKGQVERLLSAITGFLDAVLAELPAESRVRVRLAEIAVLDGRETP